MNRSYYGIGIVGCKIGVNVGTLWRSAYNFGASFLVMIAPRYHKAHRLALRRQASDTVNARLHMPFFHYETFDAFLAGRPYDCPLITVEQVPESKPLETFTHPDKALYLLGAEDTGVPTYVLAKCQHVVSIQTHLCLNVAVAGSIVMYDRQMKQAKASRSVHAVAVRNGFVSHETGMPV